jgi:DNA-binding MarR family transcriptional regulator
MQSSLPDPPTTGQQVALLLGRFARIAREMQFSQGLNPAQWESLRFMARANRYSRSPGALAAYLCTTKGTASQTLIVLEQKGLVAKLRHGRDRRQVQIQLTARGHKLLAKDPLAVIEKAAACMSQELGGQMEKCLGVLMKDLKPHCASTEFGTCLNCSNCQKPAGGGKTTCCLNGDALSPADQKLFCMHFAPIE